MADIFLSYSKRDRDLAERIGGLLRARDFSVWWDEDLTPRESWDRIIEREIAAATHVLALWTPNSVASDWVRIEANYARSCKPSRLVQARFEGCEVPMAFSMVQYADLDWERPDTSPFWPKLISWLSEGCAAGDDAAKVEAAGAPPAKFGGVRMFGQHRYEPRSLRQASPSLDAFDQLRETGTEYYADWSVDVPFPQSFMVNCLLETSFLGDWHNRSTSGIALPPTFGRGTIVAEGSRMVIDRFKGPSDYAERPGERINDAILYLVEPLQEWTGTILHTVTLSPVERSVTRITVRYSTFHRPGFLGKLLGGKRWVEDKGFEQDARKTALGLRHYAADMHDYGFPVRYSYTNEYLWDVWPAALGTLRYYPDRDGNPLAEQNLVLEKEMIGYVDQGAEGRGAEYYKQNNYVMPVREGRALIERLEKHDGDTVDYDDRIMLLRNPDHRRKLVKVCAPRAGKLVWLGETGEPPEPGSFILPHAVIAQLHCDDGIEDLSSPVAARFSQALVRSGDRIEADDVVFELDW